MLLPHRVAINASQKKMKIVVETLFFSFDFRSFYPKNFVTWNRHVILISRQHCFVSRFFYFYYFFRFQFFFFFFLFSFFLFHTIAFTKPTRTHTHKIEMGWICFFLLVLLFHFVGLAYNTYTLHTRSIRQSITKIHGSIVNKGFWLFSHIYFVAYFCLLMHTYTGALSHVCMLFLCNFDWFSTVPS